MKRWIWPPIILLAGGSSVSIVGALTTEELSGAALAGILLGSILPLAAIPFLRRDASAEAADLATAQQALDTNRIEFQAAKDSIETWRADISAQLDEQVTRIEARERALVEKFVAHQELFEFPKAGDGAGIVPSDRTQLADQDRRVLELLQQQAETAFEKIRTNGYVSNGKVDIEEIRSDVLALITNVAQVYSPESQRPLMETSFEQVARAAGRVCLHTLVLVEQLPLDVKQYNFNSLYSYVQKAVAAYGHYKSASPWLSYLSRGIHAGRFVAGANPVSLGAWVLATEVGKRAGAKAIEKYVNQQSVGLLHDFIRVIGVEVANVYGGDFRHRDPNWIYGAELAELMGRFPVSRESLSEGLRQVSALPLRNEYDRIYLYRCLADHRSAGIALADSALLTRAEREQIASQLEAFYAAYIHGTTEKQIDEWRESFEVRFDMKLKLTDNSDSPGGEARRADCVRSMACFLRFVVGIPNDEIPGRLKQTSLYADLSGSDRQAVLADLPEGFEPPDLDPADPLVDTFLNDLVQAVAAVIQPDENVEGLLAETAAYFRRPGVQVLNRMNDIFVSRTLVTLNDAARHREIPPSLARTLLLQDSRPILAYSDVARVSGDGAENLPSAWLVGFTDAPRLRLFESDSLQPVWTSDAASCHREKGFLIDDCRIEGGKWHGSVTNANAELRLSGTIRGGGYARYFGPLLNACGAPSEQ